MRKKTSKTKTLDWVSKHPELMKRLERLCEVSEGEGGDALSLEQAEAAVMEEIEKLGREALEQWLESRQGQTEQKACATKGLRRHSKKNFG